MLPTVESVAAIRAKLWDAGFRPLAVLNGDHSNPAIAGKAPIGRDWGERARQNPPECTRFDPVPHALNTGVLCDGLRAIDIDVDNPEIASRCRSLVLQRFGEAPIRMRRNSSRCLIVYRAALGQPPKLSIAGTHGKIEALGRGQQFVAYGRHQSGADLEWFPDPLGTELATSLPAINEDDLIDLLNDELAPIIDSQGLARLNGSSDHTSSEPQADPLRIAAALEKLPNNGPPDWEWWNYVGMACWAATGGSEIGWQAWAAWSARNPSYSATAARARWDHYFTSPPDRVGAGTVFHLSREAFKRAAPAETGEFPLPIVFCEDIQPNLNAADFVKGLLVEGGMSVVYGESNCGKTFFMTDLGLHVALGWEWRGRRVERGAVIYCALEGSHGIFNRVSAFKKKHNLDGKDVPFAVIPCAINMLDPAADTDKLIATIKGVASRLSLPVRMIVIDTLSRAMAGGNENAPDDMGAMVANTDKVRQATGAHVSYVHHSGKDQARGARGHSLLRAATDTEIEVAREDKDAPSVATVTKQRELDVAGEFWFRLEVIELGTNRHGEAVNSCVVTECEPSGTSGRDAKRERLPANAALCVRALVAALSKAGAKLPPTADYPANTSAVAASTWREEFYQLKSGTQDAKKHAFSRGEDTLLMRNIITQRNGLVWFVKRDRETGQTG